MLDSLQHLVGLKQSHPKVESHSLQHLVGLVESHSLQHLVGLVESHSLQHLVGLVESDSHIRKLSLTLTLFNIWLGWLSLTLFNIGLGWLGLTFVHDVYIQKVPSCSHSKDYWSNSIAESPMDMRITFWTPNPRRRRMVVRCAEAVGNLCTELHVNRIATTKDLELKPTLARIIAT